MNRLLLLPSSSSSVGKTRITPKGSGIISTSINSLKKSKNVAVYQQEYKLIEKILKNQPNVTVKINPNSGYFSAFNTVDIVTSSQIKLDDFISKLPSNLQSTFKELGLSSIEATQFQDTINKFHNFLRSNNIEYSLETDSVVDPDYPDWLQLVIVIKLKNNFNQVYSSVKSKIYDILGRNVSDNLYQKLIIKIQSN